MALERTGYQKEVLVLHDSGGFASERLVNDDYVLVFYCKFVPKFNN